MRRAIGRFISPIITYAASYFPSYSAEPLHGTYNVDDLEAGLYYPAADTAQPVENAPQARQDISPREVMADYISLVFSQDNYQQILGAGLLTVLGTGLNFLAPYLLGTVISIASELAKSNSNSSVPGVDPSSLLWNVTYLVLAYTAQQVITNRRDAILTTESAKNTGKLLETVTKSHLVKKHGFYLDQLPAERFKLLQDAFSVTNISTPLLTQVTPTLLEIAVAVVALSYKFGSPIGIGMSTMLAVYTAYSAATTKMIIQTNENMRVKGNDAFNAMVGATSQYQEIHNFNKYIATMKEVKEKLHEATQAEINARGVPLKIGLGHAVIPRIGMLLAMLYVGMRVQANQVSVPEFIALTGYLNTLSVSLPSVGQSMSQVFSSYPNLKDVFSVLRDKSHDVVDLHQDRPLQITASPEIRFDNVTFGYDEKRINPPIMHGISLAIRPGQTVALVSPSGGGKSSLFSLMRLYYEPWSGNISIDNQNISQVSIKSVQENIRLVSQKPSFFHGSIRDNIIYGASDVRYPVEKSDHPEIDERIRILAEKLGLVNLICELGRKQKDQSSGEDEFTRGLNYSIGENGSGLSPGQQQRIAILRGFIELRPIMLLDEITVGLDKIGANIVLKGAENILKENRSTVVVITHNLMEIQNVDNIFVIDGGRVVDQGTHQQLLETCPLYQKLWHENQKKDEKQEASSNAEMSPLVQSRIRSGMHAPTKDQKKQPSADPSKSDTLQGVVEMKKNK